MEEEWFAPRANRQLRRLPSPEDGNIGSVIADGQNNDSFIPDTPLRNHQGNANEVFTSPARKIHPFWEQYSAEPQQTLVDSNPFRQSPSSPPPYYHHERPQNVQQSMSFQETMHHNAPMDDNYYYHNGVKILRSSSESAAAYLDDQPRTIASTNPFLKHCMLNSEAIAEEENGFGLSDVSSETSTDHSVINPFKKKHERNASGTVSSFDIQRTRSHKGFAIPASDMSKDEGGYLNRSNTSLNKSQTSLRTEDSPGILNVAMATSTQDPVSSSGHSVRRSPSNHHPDCNISFSIPDASPTFLVSRFALLFENNKYEECTVLIQRISIPVLRTILPELPVREMITAIPHSLGLLHSLYTKLYYNDSHPFPSRQLFPSALVSRFVEWLSDNDLENDRSPYNHFLPMIQEILQVVAHVEPDLFLLINRRRVEIENSLRGLGSHGLVDTSKNQHLMDLHDALKTEFQHMSSQLKAGIQKLDDLSLSHKTPVLRSLHKGKAPSRASHQRMMQMTQSDIQQRLIKNKSLLNVVQPTMSNTYLNSLLTLLDARIEADKNVLFLFTELNKDLTQSLSTSEMLAPVFKKLAQNYNHVLDMVRKLPPCGNPCNYCDERGLICDWMTEQEELTNASQGSTTSFVGGGGGATGPGIPSSRGGQAPIDRDKPIAPPRNHSKTSRHPHHLTDHKTSSGPISIPTASSNGVGAASASSAAHNLPCSLPAGGHLEDRREADALRSEVATLRKEVTRCRDAMKKMQERESLLKERLSEQAIKQLEKGSTKFEDLNLGDNRPTQLIRRYGNLYSETRLDAFDALEDLPEIAEFDDLKGKLLFSVVVLAFRAVQRSLSDTRVKVRHLLCMPAPDTSTFSREPIVKELEDTISVYLRKFVDKYDSSKNVEEVCSQVWSTLYDYPSLKQCSGLRQYIDECVRLAWALSVQNPPLVIEYDSRLFDEDMHQRFHTSDPDSDRIRSMLWPVLREGEGGVCVHKGVVIT